MHLLAIVFGLLCFGIVAFSQNSPPPELDEGPTASLGEQPIALESDMLFRMTIRLGDIMESDPNTAKMLSSYANNEREQLYLATAVGELDGPEAATELLPVPSFDEPSDERVDDPESGSLNQQFWNDVESFRRLYQFAAQGETGSPIEAGVVTEVEADGLRERHGFYAEVALTSSLAEDSPDYKSLRTPGAQFVIVAMLGFLIAFALLAGFVLFIVAIVMISTGRIKRSFVPPVRGGSVFLEVFTLFVAGFLALKLVVGVVARDAPADAEWPSLVSIAMQWGLLAVPFWPLLRGMKMPELAHAIGLHRGKGVLREMGAGVLGYLAGLPIFIGAAILVVILMTIQQMMQGGEPAPPPSNPMFELVGGSSTLMLVLFFLTATIWAPLCEELVFRGALFRHMRGYMPTVVAAIAAGVVFAFMHNYGALLTPPLIALGFNFAMMRSWRGSLIAPMTAHALHNGTLLTLVYLLLQSIG